MLKRREILDVLVKIGIRGLTELKKNCRFYERYFTKNYSRA